MAFPSKFVSYGVVKINKFAGYNGVAVYSGPSDYTSLGGFSSARSAVDARWSGDAIIVTMRDGEVRRYTDFNNSDRID